MSNTVIHGRHNVGEKILACALSASMIVAGSALSPRTFSQVAFAETNEFGLKNSGWTHEDIPSIIAYYNNGNGGALTPAGVAKLIDLVNNINKLRETLPGYGKLGAGEYILKGDIGNPETVKDSYIDMLIDANKQKSTQNFSSEIDKKVKELQDKATQEPEHADAINAVIEEMKEYKNTVTSDDLVNPEKLANVVHKIEEFAGTHLEDKIKEKEAEQITASKGRLSEQVKDLHILFKDHGYLSKENSDKLILLIIDVEDMIGRDTYTLTELKNKELEVTEFLKEAPTLIEKEKKTHLTADLNLQKTALEEMLDTKKAFLSPEELKLVEDLKAQIDALLAQPDSSSNEMAQLRDTIKATLSELNKKAAERETVAIAEIKEEIKQLLTKMHDLFNEVKHNFSAEDVERFEKDYTEISSTFMDMYTTYEELTEFRAEVLKAIDVLNEYPRQAKPATGSTSSVKAIPHTGEIQSVYEIMAISGVTLLGSALSVVKRKK